MLAASRGTGLSPRQQRPHALGFECGGTLATSCHRIPPLDLLHCSSLVVQLLGVTTESQAIAQCLISKVIVTAEAVDIHYVLPFESAPRVAPWPTKAPEGTPGHFYRLRLAHFRLPALAGRLGQLSDRIDRRIKMTLEGRRIGHRAA
jgi:hypothetical protein